MTQLGARIKARRVELSLSQGRLAEAAGITASAVSQIESGAIRTLKYETLSRVALALQTTPLELDATPESVEAALAALTDDERQLLHSYRSLPAPLQPIALRLLKALY